MDAALAELRSLIADRVREGFESADEIVEGLADHDLALERDDLAAAVGRLTAEALAAHMAEQAGWPAVTDCDRLDQAFAALTERGIVARQNFSCCNNCGHAEILDEVAAEEELRVVSGYVFYHLQCTEMAVESGRLMLAYGCVDDGQEELTRVAMAILTELRRAGLKAKWQGTAGPIVVDKLVLRRRR